MKGRGGRAQRGQAGVALRKQWRTCNTHACTSWERDPGVPGGGDPCGEGCGEGGSARRAADGAHMAARGSRSRCEDLRRRSEFLSNPQGAAGWCSRLLMWKRARASRYCEAASRQIAARQPEVNPRISPVLFT